LGESRSGVSAAMLRAGAGESSLRAASQSAAVLAQPVESSRPSTSTGVSHHQNLSRPRSSQGAAAAWHCGHTRERPQPGLASVALIASRRIGRLLSDRYDCCKTRRALRA